MKKNCFLCSKITKQTITNKEIRGKVKCKVFKCLSCELEYLDKNFVKVFLTDKFYKKITLNFMTKVFLQIKIIIT